MIISINSENVFKKIQHSFLIKKEINSLECGHRRTYLSRIRDIYYKPAANIILNSEKVKAILLRSGTRQVCLLLALFDSLKVLAKAIRKEKVIKEIPIGKEVKLSFCVRDM